MKTYLFILSLLIAILISGCDTNEYFYEADYYPPEPPTGLTMLNGDSRVDFYWNPNRESDLSGYNIYYSYAYDGRYTLMGTTLNNYYIDYDVANGNTYFYAVTAFDYNGNESELSYDFIYAVPRPEGFNQSIFDYRKFPNNSGYSFQNYSVVPFDNLTSDVYFENYFGGFYLDVWDDTDIQDMGYTQDIYDIQFAPVNGWSPSKDAIAVPGHTYVIWTWDNHFAKIRISSITNERIVFDWAFQMIEGETLLKPRDIPSQRHPLFRVER